MVDHAVNKGFGGTGFFSVAVDAKVEVAVEVADRDGGVRNLFLFDAHKPPTEGALSAKEDSQGGEADAFFKPLALRAVQNSDGQGGAEEEADGEFVEGVEDHGSQQADEEAADRAAKGHGDVEASQIARVGLEAGEFAVADHAGDEKRGGDDGNALEDGEAFAFTVEDPGEVDIEAGQRGEEEPAVVDTAGIEAEDEGEEVKNERENPEEGDSGDVLGEIAR